VTRTGQLEMLRRQPSAYGGELLKRRRGRAHGGRPLTTRTTMHLVLRSTKAVGEWSFKQKTNESRIEKIISRFAAKYGVHIHSLANVGNHLHLHVKLGNRYTYRPFIRAVTSAIATAVTGTNRWNSMREQFLRKQSKQNSINSNGVVNKGREFDTQEIQAQGKIDMEKVEQGKAEMEKTKTEKIKIESESEQGCFRFWDYRPFTRIVEGFRAFLNLRDYIQVNRLEGYGYSRGEARMIVSSQNGNPLETRKQSIAHTSQFRKLVLNTS
jgi:REP element-mobilizing transposase RayT